MELRLKPFGKANVRQQAPRLLRIVLIVFCRCAKLIDGQRPLGQAARHSRGRRAPDGHGVNEPLPIDGV
jgi:hypothetical protein